jgi:hypothetical protein
LINLDIVEGPSRDGRDDCLADRGVAAATRAEEEDAAHNGKQRHDAGHEERKSGSERA